MWQFAYRDPTEAAGHLSSTAFRKLSNPRIGRYYGVKLFDRISRKLYLTSFGEEFLNYASHIVSLFEKMETEMKNWDSVGTLRVGSSITIGTYLMPQYALEFRKKYPKINLKVFVDNASMIEKMILANEIDFALTEGRVHSSHVVYEKFMDDELILLCAPNDPLSEKQKVSLSDLLDQDFILQEKGSSTRELFDSILLIPSNRNSANLEKCQSTGYYKSSGIRSWYFYFTLSVGKGRIEKTTNFPNMGGRSFF